VIVVDPTSHEAERVAAHLGAELPDDLTAAAARCDVLIADEWTPESAPQVRAARAAGARVTCLAEIVLERAAVPVVGITGTAGKTTACHRLAAMLDGAVRPYAMGRTARAANAWPDAALLEAAATLRPPAVIVMELTSSHLAFMARSPQVAVVTCFWPDHVELHGSVAAYRAAKERIVRFQRPGDLALLGPGVDFAAPARVERFAGDPAAAVARALGLEPVAVDVPLPHRFNEVAVVGGVQIVDDSMAATPAKAERGIRRAGPCTVLLAGGDDGGGVHGDATEQDALARACAAADGLRVVAFGPAAPRIVAHLPAAEVVADLRAAVARGLALAAPGDTLLLAPMFPLTMAEREGFAARFSR
jgi:UDP-N-acetylmuramoylalanine--D-glutamate ligase